MAKSQTSREFPGWTATFAINQGSGRDFLVDLSLNGVKGFALLRGEYRPPQPVAARWAMGSAKPTTLIWTRLVSPFLITESFARQLEEDGLSGWDTYPVEVSGKDGSTIPGYRGFVITGRCGPIDDRRSIQVPKVFPAGTFPVWKGIFFDEESWDGSDFFMPEGNNGMMFAVERAVDAFRRAKIRNVEFTPLAEVERMRL